MNLAKQLVMVWARQLARRLRKQYSYIYQNIATYIVKNIATDPYKSEKNITRDPAKKPQFMNYYRHTALRKVTTETTKSNFKSQIFFKILKVLRRLVCWIKKMNPG